MTEEGEVLRVQKQLQSVAENHRDGVRALRETAEGLTASLPELRKIVRLAELLPGVLEEYADGLEKGAKDLDWVAERMYAVVPEHVETEVPVGRRHLANLTDEEVLDLLDKLERWTLRYHVQNRGQHPTVRRAAGYMQMNHQDLWALTTFSPYLDTRQQRNTSGVGHRLIVDTRAK